MNMQHLSDISTGPVLLSVSV